MLKATEIHLFTYSLLFAQTWSLLLNCVLANEVYQAHKGTVDLNDCTNLQAEFQGWLCCFSAREEVRKAVVVKRNNYFYSTENQWQQSDLVQYLQHMKSDTQRDISNKYCSPQFFRFAYFGNTFKEDHIYDGLWGIHYALWLVATQELWRQDWK